MRFNVLAQQIGKLLSPKELAKVGRGDINKKPTLVFLDRNNLKADLKLTDKQIDRMYAKLENVVRTQENMFWVGPGGGPISTGKILSKDFKTIAVIPTKGKSNPFAQVSVINNVIRSVTSRKLNLVNGHLTDSVGEESIRSRLINSQKSGSFTDIIEPAGKAFNSTRRTLRRNRGKFFKEELDFKYTFQETKKIITSFKKNNAQFKDDFIVTIVPQTASSNSRLSGLFESNFGNNELKKLKDSVLEVSSSPTTRKILEQVIVNKFLEKGSVRVKSNKKVTENKKVKVKRKFNAHAASIPALRNSQGQFTNVLKIQNLINQRLHETIKANMGNSGDAPDPGKPLRYQEGDLARSAKVTLISQTRANTLEIFYTYQRYPYDTFAPGGKQHSTGRNPQTLIRGSVRELATQLIGAKLGLSVRLEGK